MYDGKYNIVFGMYTRRDVREKPCDMNDYDWIKLRDLFFTKKPHKHGAYIQRWKLKYRER